MRGLPDRARRSSESYSIIAVERPAPGIVFERAIESVGHRAHLTPQFGLENVSAPRHNLLGKEGGGLALTAASFTGTAALVGIFGVALMRAAFDFACNSPGPNGAAAFIRSSSIRRSDTLWPTRR